MFKNLATASGLQQHTGTSTNAVHDISDSSRRHLSESDRDFADKAQNLESLRTLVVDAASVSGGLWFSYVFVVLYLFVAVGSVTHKDLFFESPIKLPFLGIELPLLGFFWFIPLLFLITHAYILLHFAILADRTKTFVTALEERFSECIKTQIELRKQLPTNLLVQAIAGPREIGGRAVRTLLQIVAWMSLIICPVVLLIFFLIQFLPYHHEWVSNWQRISIIIDLGLIWVIWFSVANATNSWRRSIRSILRIALAVFASFITVVTVTTVATFPGEKLHEYRNLFAIPTSWDEENGRSWTTAHKFLIDGDINWAARSPNSLWSNRIILPGLDIIDRSKIDSDSKIDWVGRTLSMRNRNFRNAVLVDAKLINADMTSIDLSNALLTNADLRGAKLDCESDDKNVPRCSNLQNVDLRGATLQSAVLDGANLQGAILNNTKLQGASLNSTKLQGASLFEANLQGASLVGAQLQGSQLQRAQLQTAFFMDANLTAAYLYETKLQGAVLWNVDLRGAVLVRTSQTGAMFHNVNAWRSKVSEAESTHVLHNRIYFDEISEDEYDKLILDIERFGFKNKYPDIMRDHIKRYLNPKITFPAIVKKRDERYWVINGQASSNSSKHQSYMCKVATILKKSACAFDGSSHVLNQIAKRFNPQDMGRHFGNRGLEDEKLAIRYLSKIAEDFLEGNCKSAAKISDEAREMLTARRWTGNFSDVLDNTDPTKDPVIGCFPEKSASTGGRSLSNVPK